MSTEAGWPEARLIDSLLVFEGLCVPSAGIVADSIPIKAKNVRAAVAVNALKFDSPLVFNVIK